MIHHVPLACPPGSQDTLRGFHTGCWTSRNWQAARARSPWRLLVRWPWDRAAPRRGARVPPARKAHPGRLVHDLDAWAAGLRHTCNNRVFATRDPRSQLGRSFNF
jgi:hypothetical protein